MSAKSEAKARERDEKRRAALQRIIANGGSMWDYNFRYTQQQSLIRARYVMRKSQAPSGYPNSYTLHITEAGRKFAAQLAEIKESEKRE